MKLFCSLLLMLIFILPGWGEYAFQIATERDTEGKCINWRDVTADVTYTLNPDSTQQVFVDHPDESAVDDDDLQEWYIANNDSSGFYLVSFSFADVGLSIAPNRKYMQYWFRYSKDGALFSESSAVAVMKPGKPTKK